MLKKTLRDGFTLVELSFSLLFIGILSIIIVLIINNTVVAYRRGLLLGQFNSNGTELVDDIRAAVQNSSSWSLKDACLVYAESNADMQDCNSGGGLSLAYVKKVVSVTVDGAEGLRPIYGTFCTGSYSYIWNSGYFEYENAIFQEKESRGWAKLRYKVGDDDTVKTIGGGEKPFRLLKVEDSSRAVCRAAMGGGYADFDIEYNSLEGSWWQQDPTEISEVIDISDMGIGSEPEELLTGDNSNTLALYDLSVIRPLEDRNGRNMFYYGSFILGTTNDGADVTANGIGACMTQGGGDAEGYAGYCNGINRFIFAAQVNGG